MTKLFHCFMCCTILAMIVYIILMVDVQVEHLPLKIEEAASDLSSKFSNWIKNDAFIYKYINFIRKTIQNESGTSSAKISPEAVEVSQNYIPKQYNVLFIVVDDLRPQFGAYMGKDYVTSFQQRKIFTPNMDRLAKKSLLLKRAYAQFSLCGPSRSSFLTSRRPDTTKVYQNFVHFRQSGGNFITLPQYFKEKGYEVVGAGKIYHVDGSPDKDDPLSWTQPYFQAKYRRHISNTKTNWLSVPHKVRVQKPLEDDQIVYKTLEHLDNMAERAKSGEKRFFIGIGFYRPHVPLICPEEFFKLYPLERGDYMPEKEWQSPLKGQHCNMAPFRGVTYNVTTSRIPEETMRRIRRAYFACVTYIDHMIGIILDALESHKLHESTVVALVSDHGIHLGENDWYSKYTTHEVSLHVPFMLHIPGVTNKGIESRSLVELTDIFPTVVEAAGHERIKQCPLRSDQFTLCTEGVSLLPLINRPAAVLRKAAYSQVSRGEEVSEYTIRTHRYRLVDFAKISHSKHQMGENRYDIIWNINLEQSPYIRQLYDHNIDPDETINKFYDKKYKAVIDTLLEKLHSKFTVIYNFSYNVSKSNT